MSFSCWNTFVCAVVIVFFDSVYAFRDGTPESPLNFTGGVSVPGKNESRYAAYSKWTKWSKCFVSDPSCEKKRFRVCLYQEAPDKCPHGPVLVQSKACKRKKCFGKSKYKSRFRLIDDLFERTTSLEEFFFTSWSQWTDCYLKECKQYRWKICSFELICKERLRVQQRHCNEDLQDMCLEFQKDFLPAETVREEEPQLEDHWTEATTKLPVMVTKHTKKPRVSFSKSDNMTCGVAPLSSTRISTKIFGGQPSTAGRWPWQVQSSRYWCRCNTKDFMFGISKWLWVPLEIFFLTNLPVRKFFAFLGSFPAYARHWYSSLLDQKAKSPANHEFWNSTILKVCLYGSGAEQQRFCEENFSHVIFPALINLISAW